MAKLPGKLAGGPGRGMGKVGEAGIYIELLPVILVCTHHYPVTCGLFSYSHRNKNGYNSGRIGTYLVCCWATAVSSSFCTVIKSSVQHSIAPRLRHPINSSSVVEDARYAITKFCFNRIHRCSKHISGETKKNPRMYTER